MIALYALGYFKCAALTLTDLNRFPKNVSQKSQSKVINIKRNSQNILCRKRRKIDLSRYTYWLVVHCFWPLRNFSFICRYWICLYVIIYRQYSNHVWYTSFKKYCQFSKIFRSVFTCIKTWYLYIRIYLI